MKNKMKKYSTGGDILGGISALAPLLSLIPGGAIAAPIVSGLAGMGKGMLDKREAEKAAANNMAPASYANSNAFGFKSGGPIDPIKVNNKSEFPNLMEEFTVISTQNKNKKKRQMLQAFSKNDENLKKYSEKDLQAFRATDEYELWKQANRPDVNVIEKTSSVLPYFNGFNNSINIPIHDNGEYDRDMFNQEIAHAIRNVAGLDNNKDFIKNIPFQLARQLSDNPSKSFGMRSPYDTVGNEEYETHKIFQPLMEKAYSTSKYANKRKIDVTPISNFEASPSLKFESGGSLSAIGDSAAMVTGAPGVVDGNLIKYKGKDIKLNHGELLDADNDRVISKDNPEILKAYKRAEISSAKATKSFQKTNDTAAKNTVDIMKQIKDSLFQKQEAIAMAQGKRNSDGSTVQNGQKFKTGGNIPKYGPGGPIGPIDWVGLMKNMNNGMTQGGYGSTPPEFGNPWDKMSYAEAQAQDTLAHTSFDPLKPLAMKPVSSIQERTPAINMVRQANNSSFKTESGVQESGTGAGFLGMTPGELVGLSSGLASIAGKGAMALQKVQVEPYRPNNSAISLNQLDPTAAIMNNQRSYESALNGLNGQTGSFNQRQALASNLFANKLQANNNVYQQYGEQNSRIATDYENRVANRTQQNIQSATMTDDLNSRNRAAKFNAVQGLFSDIATLGQQTGQVMNSNLSNQTAMAAMSALSPDVFNNLIKKLPKDQQRQLISLRNGNG